MELAEALKKLEGLAQELEGIREPVEVATTLSVYNQEVSSLVKLYLEREERGFRARDVIAIYSIFERLEEGLKGIKDLIGYEFKFHGKKKFKFSKEHFSLYSRTLGYIDKALKPLVRAFSDRIIEEIERYKERINRMLRRYG